MADTEEVKLPETIFGEVFGKSALSVHSVAVPMSISVSGLRSLWWPEVWPDDFTSE